MNIIQLLVCPLIQATTHFKEEFLDENAFSRWTQSQAKEYGTFTWQRGTKHGEVLIGKGIQTSNDAHFYAFSSSIPTPFTNSDAKLVVGFTVKHEQDIDCGGGYIKLLPELEGSKFDGDSEYFIMFGPDICGPTRKIHLIFNYNGRNLLWKKEPRCADDTLTHAYKLVVNPDNTYEVYLDNDKVESGLLEDDWDFLPPKLIEDPEDKKPIDWVDNETIDDPMDIKPSNWDDEPEMIPDPKATRPVHWDDEEDGIWEAPLLQNPKYRGVWKAKRIANPAYKGRWSPRKIANPAYSPDEQLYLARKPIAAVGFDLWQVKSGTIFDNIIISDSIEEVDAFLESRLLGVVAKERELALEKSPSEKHENGAEYAEEEEKEL
ncbi:hypothetical protein XU18_4348 [Perkinsela sp. CCAP 1560/4]|nr:hypothetical protein XU18_4348 [Perkinsela sp. CCAP 1560/4]|eukprot:KNH04381.1 hypothetical protein XU18_4348 [Perkinsela sp. CCAP 1560/4]